MVADPYRVFDCCLETDGACAVVITTASEPRGTASRSDPDRLVGAGRIRRDSWCGHEQRRVNGGTTPRVVV